MEYCKHLTRHHIIPKSRGGRNGDNIAYIPDREHKYYHALFENRTPPEIIQYLNERFWNGKYRGLEAIETFK